MDDTLKNLAFGFLAFLVVNGKLQKRVEHDAARQVREAFAYTGQVSARVDQGGLFGLVTNHVSAVEITGTGLVTDRLPFSVYPRSGWKGSIRHLRLHFQDFTLAGLPIDRFDADIPDATYDLGHALYKHRLQLRSVGIGIGKVEVGASGLEAFVRRKYHDTLSDVKVLFQNGQMVLIGKVLLFQQSLPIHATGRLVPRAGRYVDMIEPDIRLNNAPLNASLSATVLKQINPVLDSENDLHLGGVFVLENVTVGDRRLIIMGKVTVPLAPMSSTSTSKSKP